MDVKDLRILYELDQNARQPLSRLAKRVGISKQTAGFRVARLVKRGVIAKFLTIMDVSKMGYANYKVFVRLQNMKPNDEKRLGRYLTRHPRVMFVAWCDGEFDLVFNLLAQTPHEAYAQIRNFESAFGPLIAEKQVAVMVSVEFFSRDLPAHREFRRANRVRYGSNPEPIELTKLDHAILEELGGDARVRAAAIARRQGVPQESVRNRIRAMEKAGVITHYMLVLDNAAIGREHLKILFSLKSLPRERETEFREFLKSELGAYFSAQLLGPYDWEVNLEPDDRKVFRRKLFRMKRNFGDIVRRYTVLNMYTVDKFNHHPMDADGKPLNERARRTPRNAKDNESARVFAQLVGGRFPKP